MACEKKEKLIQQMKTKKKNIGILLIVTGILLGICLAVYSFIGIKQQKETVASAKADMVPFELLAEESEAAKVSSFLTGFDEANETVLDENPLMPDQDAVKALVQESENGMAFWGILEIPSIGLTEAIAEGDSQTVMKNAIWHMTDTPFPSGFGGNCVLSGHRSVTYGKNFNRLDEVEVKDRIILNTANWIFTYRVYEILVVEPSDVSVVDDSEKPTLTLITCTPLGIASHRLILHCELQSVEEVK